MTRFSVHAVTQGELIERLAAERPGREALLFPDRALALDFAALERRSMELARGLVAAGIRPGERIALWSDNRPDWIPLQFAIARIGAILVTANTALCGPEIEYLLRQSRSAAVIAAPGFAGEEYFEILGELRARTDALPDLREWIALEGAAPGGLVPLEEIVRRGATVAEETVRERTRATRVDDAANIQYTSGTTGFPKGVVLTHRNIVDNAWTISRRMALGDDDRLLLQVPLFHCFGCVVTVLGAYSHGLPIVAVQRFEPKASLAAIEAGRATIVYGVPAMYLAMLSDPEFRSRDTSSLRAGIMAAAMCPEPLMRRVIDEMGCKGMLVAYGLTEASPGVTCSNPDDSIAVRCGSVGDVLDGVEVRIVDPATGAELGRDERGEIQVRGSNVMQGYFEDPAATAEAITPDGWLRTGDLGTLDADDRLHIAGRIKEMIIRGGENVYPAEVEEALRAHEAVRDAAVFGIEDEKLGEDVAAAVILEPGSRLGAEELAAWMEKRLAHYKRPRRFVFVDAFPMTPSGKVQKFRLPELLQTVA